MSELISVIIPVYKVEKYLNQCVASVAEQTYRHLEIILVDDGSPDRCGELCDALAQKDQRIRVVHKKNGGLSDARNAGLNVATGDYIAFVDSDDYIAPTMLEALLSALQQETADIAECNYVCFEDSQEPKAPSISGECSSYATQQALALLLEERTFKYTAWNKLYKKAVFSFLQFEVGKLHEDVFFTYQAFACCKRIAKLSAPLYYYRQRQGSIMGSAFSLRTLDSLEARVRQYRFIKANYSELSGKAQSQLLGNCLYLAQRALCSTDANVKRAAIQRIRPIYFDIYEDMRIQEGFKQKLWYRMARLNFQFCCKVRNMLRIGL